MTPVTSELLLSYVASRDHTVKELADMVRDGSSKSLIADRKRYIRYLERDIDELRSRENSVE